MPASSDYTVLEILTAAGAEHVTLDAVATQAGVSTAKVESTIDLLNRLGVPVDSHPAYGLRISVPFDLVALSRVVHGLKQQSIEWEVHGYLETESTNDLATAAGDTGAPDGTTFLTEHQTKGRGRLGRTWHSPVGSGLWFSVVRRHDLPIDAGWRVTLGAGLAVAQAIQNLTAIEPQLKWPNDVLIDGRKVAGILTESKTEGERLKQSVVGIGVNVHLERREFPKDLQEIACSIASEGGRVARTELLIGILAGLERSMKISAADLRIAWTDMCPHWGGRVRVERDRSAVEGTALGLAEDGAFMIELDDGTRYPVHAGDVTHLRPTV